MKLRIAIIYDMNCSTAYLSRAMKSFLEAFLAFKPPFQIHFFIDINNPL